MMSDSIVWYCIFFIVLSCEFNLYSFMGNSNHEIISVVGSLKIVNKKRYSFVFLYKSYIFNNGWTFRKVL